jgi:hypothetical protein
MLVLVPPAVAVKEVFLALMVVFFVIAVIWKFIFRYKQFSVTWIFAGLVIGILAKVVLNRYFPSVSPGRNSFLVMAFHVREMLLHPDHALRWVLGLFAAFGAFLFFPIKKLKDIQIVDKDDLPVHILSISVLALSFLGGMDYTRLIFLGFPFIIISFIKIGRPKTDEFIWALLLTLCLTRFWMVLPDVLGDVTVYNAWMPEYADSTYLICWTFALLIYLMLYFGGLSFLRKLISRGQIAE